MPERDLFISSMECALPCSQHRDLLQRHCKSEDQHTARYQQIGIRSLSLSLSLCFAARWQFSWEVEVEEEQGWRKEREEVIFRLGGIGESGRGSQANERRWRRNHWLQHPGRQPQRTTGCTEQAQMGVTETRPRCFRDTATTQSLAIHVTARICSPPSCYFLLK